MLAYSSFLVVYSLCVLLAARILFGSGLALLLALLPFLLPQLLFPPPFACLAYLTLLLPFDLSAISFPAFAEVTTLPITNNRALIELLAVVGLVFFYPCMGF
jgi:hypothetical protein